jgi:hypothetical protein
MSHSSSAQWNRQEQQGNRAVPIVEAVQADRSVGQINFRFSEVMSSPGIKNIPLAIFGKSEL